MTASANCDFKQGNHISGLQDPTKLKLIEVVIPKSANYAKNSMRIITSKSKNIPPKLKKSFEADIIVHYQFGQCSFKGKVRQSGDWKDHIKFSDGGKLIRSLDVKMRTGNIFSSVHFKLLIPSTRNSENEILATLILRSLNFISPDTFAVKTKINGVHSVMLFQETARKELIEKNNRRESALFEGDEKLLWSYKNFELLGLSSLSLARMTNKNWLLKGKSSAKISLYSFSRLQASHIDRVGNIIRPNKEETSDFNNFAFLLLAMNGDHGLTIHNRKYFFNAIASKFEPVYYDGNVLFSELGTNTNSKALNQTIKNLSFPIDRDFVDGILKNIESTKLKENFIKRSKNLNFDQELFLNSSLSHLRQNIKTLENLLDKNQREAPASSSGKLNNYLRNSKNSKISQSIIREISMNSEKFKATYQDGSARQFSIREVSDLISKNEINDERTVFLGNFLDRNKTEIINHKYIEFDGEILSSSGISVSFNISEKKISFQQSKPNDWVLIKSARLDEWKLDMNGIQNTKTKESELIQRFNEFGLTGCLSIFDSKLSQTSVNIKGGSCEDALNIISSEGSLETIIIKDAFADAIDLDFSSLDIDNIIIDKAGNDCVDVSGGNYSINFLNLKNCGDKGTSIGEMSKFSASNLNIISTKVGVSTKDLSEARIQNVKITEADKCIEVTQKKQEFGGANLEIDKLNCVGEIEIDNNSIYRNVNH
jgi:hypothetical protein